MKYLLIILLLTGCVSTRDSMIAEGQQKCSRAGLDLVMVVISPEKELGTAFCTRTVK